MKRICSELSAPLCCIKGRPNPRIEGEGGQMPRRRTSNRPLRRRIKLNTQQDVQSELGKVYRSVDAGNMSPAEGTRRVFMLDKLRASGLPDARAKADGGYVAPVLNVFSVPSGYFLS